MKKVKRTQYILALLLVAVLVLSSGCGISIRGGNSDITHGNVEEGGTLELGIVNKGYGDEFLYKMAEAFQEKTGIRTRVEKSSSADWTDTQMKSGAENNTLDVIFDINHFGLRNVAQKNYVKGYDRAYADLSDIYDAPLEGYGTDKTLEELVFPYSLDACTWGGEDKGYGDGKQYFVNWSTCVQGLIYNQDLFEKYKLEVPKTTDELFALMKQMATINNGTYVLNENDFKIYPFVYSGKNDYTRYLVDVWWAQYDGIDTFRNVLEGKDENGVISSKSMQASGKLSALQIIADILDRDAAYTEAASCLGLSFTDAQMKFLDNQAFMIPTGDWLEREMENSYEAGTNIAFMRIPVNSDVVDKCATVKTDEQLSEVISYIDGDTETRPAYVSDEDLAMLTSARSIYHSEGSANIAYIPAYSDNIKAAKQFLQFVLSKEGQEIMLEYAYGNMAMLNVDMKNFEYYDSLSPLQKSKLDIIGENGGVQFVGANYTHPMSYAGGVRLQYSGWIQAFAAAKTSETYMTAVEFFRKDYTTNLTYWDQWVANAGVN